MLTALTDRRKVKSVNGAVAGHLADRRTARPAPQTSD